MIIEIKGTMTGCQNKKETTKAGKEFQYCEVLIDTHEERGGIYMVKAKPNDPLVTGRVGDDVRVGCFFNSREWQGKYFYDLKLAKMDVIGSPAEAVEPEQVAAEIAEEEKQGEGQDLPF